MKNRNRDNKKKNDKMQVTPFDGLVNGLSYRSHVKCWIKSSVQRARGKKRQKQNELLVGFMLDLCYHTFRRNHSKWWINFNNINITWNQKQTQSDATGNTFLLLSCYDSFHDKWDRSLRVHLPVKVMMVLSALDTPIDTVLRARSDWKRIYTLNALCHKNQLYSA